MNSYLKINDFFHSRIQKVVSLRNVSTDRKRERVSDCLKPFYLLMWEQQGSNL